MGSWSAVTGAFCPAPVIARCSARLDSVQLTTSVIAEHPAGRPDVVPRVGSGDIGETEILGLDPSHDASDPKVGRWLRDVLWDRAVLCVRLDAKLTDGELRALVSMIGDIKDPVGHDSDGNPLRYGEERQIIDAGFVLTDELRESLGDVSFGGDDLRPGLFQFFHTDDSYVEQPAGVTVLHARELPQGGGGDTCFIDMRAAYELLDATQRSQLIGLQRCTRTTTAALSRPGLLRVGRSRISSTSRIPSCARTPSPAGLRSTSISTARPTSKAFRTTKDARCCSRCRITRNRTPRDTSTSGTRTMC